MTEETRKVVITDIRMRFWSMVWFMVKWVIASIPALVILGTIVVAIGTVLAVLFGYDTSY